MRETMSCTRVNACTRWYDSISLRVDFAISVTVPSRAMAAMTSDTSASISIMPVWFFMCR